MKQRIVIIGTSEFGLPSFAALQQSLNIDIVAAVTQPAKPVGRSRQVSPSPVERWATERHIPVMTFPSLKTQDAQQRLRSLEADIFVVASYGLLLPQAVLEIPKFGCLNIHGSLLPRWRGASPIAQAIAHGDTETGITFMLMDAGCDTGPMLESYRVPIPHDANRPQLESLLASLAAEHIVDTVEKVCTKQITPMQQPVTGVTLAPRLQRDDGRAIWESAEVLVRLTRAYAPWPGVWTAWGKYHIKILAASARTEQRHEPVGTVVPIDAAWGIVCKDGMLVPQVVQFSGRQPQPASTIPGGYPKFIGSRLGD